MIRFAIAVVSYLAFSLCPGFVLAFHLSAWVYAKNQAPQIVVLIPSVVLALFFVVIFRNRREKRRSFFISLATTFLLVASAIIFLVLTLTSLTELEEIGNVYHLVVTGSLTVHESDHPGYLMTAFAIVAGFFSGLTVISTSLVIKNISDLFHRKGQITDNHQKSLL